MIALIDRLLDKLAYAASIGYRAILAFIVNMMIIGVLNRLTGFTVRTPAMQAALYLFLITFSVFIAILLTRKAERAKEAKADGDVKNRAPFGKGAQQTDAKPAPQPEPVIDILAMIDKMYAPIPASDDPDAPPDPLVRQVQNKPIVFGRYCPLPASPTLTFTGGLPIGPADLQWPKGKRTDGGTIPLHFIMQWDCATLSKVDPSGCLPKDGVLYFFSATEWGISFDCQFIHCGGPTKDWQEIAPPDDLPAVMGTDGAWQAPYIAISGIPKEEQPDFAADAPVILPKWAFEPLAFDYPVPEVSPSDEDEEDWEYSGGSWHESTAVENALYALQQQWSPLPDRIDRREPQSQGRPFPAFPQDWAAVRIVAAEIIEKTNRGYIDPQWKRLWPDLDDSQRQTRLEGWYKEARELYAFARQFPLTDRPEPAMREMVWEWMQSARDAHVGPYGHAADICVKTSIGLNSAGVAEIPVEWIEDARRYLALGSCTIREQYFHEFTAESGVVGTDQEKEALYELRKSEGLLPETRGIHAPTPARMFGAPRIVQDEMERYGGHWILLLEFSSGDVDGLGLGDGVLKYFIRPDDLRAGRFDRVEAVASSY